MQRVIALLFCCFFTIYLSAQDTIVVDLFSFSDPSPQGWSKPYEGTFHFPESDESWEKIIMVKQLKCDSSTTHDKYPCGEWDYSTKTIVYIPDGDTTESFELSAFVTPYGKRLIMGGKKGWTWYQDVSDYAPILRGEKRISSGNNQELLQLQFWFIKGTPARQAIKIENIYPYGSYKYEYLADDSLLQKKKIVLDPNANSFRLKARISGHGHAGPRNCCEWDSKNHTYYIGEWDHFRWNVWKDCGFNPIFPQGGTWQFDRAGWCPGTFVDDYNFELSKYTEPGDTIDIDYAIEAYADNGEKDGEYRMSHQLVSYGPNNFKSDAAIVDIIAPSEKDEYSRINPIISNPIIKIKNNGTRSLNSLKISYWIKGMEKQSFQWYGNLNFLEEELITLPPISWQPNKSLNNFYVEISEPNSSEDEYDQNNHLSSSFKYPDLLAKQFTLKILTNDLGRAKELGLIIRDEQHQLVFEKTDFQDSTTYEFPFDLDNGMYQIIFTDIKEDGMIMHWWNRNDAPDQMGKNGRIEILDKKGERIKWLHFDFAEKLYYSFRVE